MDIEKMMAGKVIGPVLEEWLVALENSEGVVALSDLPVGELSEGTVKTLRNELHQFGLLVPVRATPSAASKVVGLRLTPLGRRWLGSDESRQFRVYSSLVV